MMYHYTNIDSFLSIMGHEACPTFRAFDVRSFLNQDELSYDFSFLFPILKEMEEKLNIHYLYRISEFRERRWITDCRVEKYVDFNEENDFIPYVVCLSTDSNNEYLWKSQKKEPVCIYIEEQYFNKGEKDCMCWGNNVMYGPDITRIQSCLAGWYETYQSYFNRTNIINVNENECKVLFALRYDIYPFIKQNKEKYIKEKEYRIVCAITNKELIKYTVGNRAYYEMKIPAKAIRRVQFSQDIPNKRIEEVFRELSLSGYEVEMSEKSIIFNVHS